MFIIVNKQAVSRYLPSMGVKIKHTVGVQNKDVFK